MPRGRAMAAWADQGLMRLGLGFGFGLSLGLQSERKVLRLGLISIKVAADW